jgi:hypothetical protein
VILLCWAAHVIHDSSVDALDANTGREARMREDGFVPGWNIGLLGRCRSAHGGLGDSKEERGMGREECGSNVAKRHIDLESCRGR